MPELREGLWADEYGREHCNDEEGAPGEPSVREAADPADEARSLRKFYRSMGGKGWRNKDGWSARGVDADQFGLTDFDGVAVGLGGLVDEIRLKDNNLSATFMGIPDNLQQRWGALTSFRSLTVLDVSKNSLEGPFPECVAKLLSLEELDLSHNCLSGMIPGSQLRELPVLRRLRLNDNSLSGIVPEELKQMDSLELLDCRNNYISDVLPAWACIGAVHTDASDPYPSELFVFIMDASLKWVEGLPDSTREAQAHLRADEWMRWHLAKAEQQRCRATHLGQVQVELVALRQHVEADVHFCINTGGDASRTIEFGKEGGLPSAVFGAVCDTKTSDDFPHVVIGLNVVTARNPESSLALPPPIRPYGPFTIRSTDTWETLVRRRDLRNAIEAGLMYECLAASVAIFVLFLTNLSSVWLWMAPLVLVSFWAAVVVFIYFARRTWVTFVCAASSGPEKFARFLVWVTVAGCFATIGLVPIFFWFMVVSVATLLFHLVRLLLIPCYRVAGLWGKLPTLTLTVEPTDIGSETLV